MNHKLLLVYGITLLYWESKLPNPTEKSTDIIKKVLESVKPAPTLVTGFGAEDDGVLDLRSLLHDMCEDPITQEYERSVIMQRIRICLGEDRNTFEAFKDGIDIDLEESQIKRTCSNLRDRLEAHNREMEVKRIFSEASMNTRFKSESLGDFSEYVGEVLELLEPYTKSHKESDPAILNVVDFEDDSSIITAYQTVQGNSTGANVLRTGWQGLNDMFQGGLRRGEFGVLGALQHNYKTGNALSLYCDMALYNEPILKDIRKKPMILWISFEDGNDLNMKFLYSRIYEGQTGAMADFTGATAEDLAQYVKRELGVNGFISRILRVDPNQWTYRKMIQYMMELEADGYEIIYVGCDYLKMMPTTGCIGHATGQDVRDMFRRMRAYTNPRDILFFTPHQLSPDAKTLARQGGKDFIKQIANMGYYDGCKTLDNEVDWELSFHIEKLNGDSYMTYQRGKHRGMPVIPDSRKYLVYKMYPIGGIPADINGPTQARRKVGGGVEGSGEEIPFWEMAEAA